MNHRDRHGNFVTKPLDIYIYTVMVTSLRNVVIDYRYETSSISIIANVSTSYFIVGFPLVRPAEGTRDSGNAWTFRIAIICRAKVQNLVKFSNCHYMPCIKYKISWTFRIAHKKYKISSNSATIKRTSRATDLRFSAALAAELNTSWNHSQHYGSMVPRDVSGALISVEPSFRSPLAKMFFFRLEPRQVAAIKCKYVLD